MVYITRLTLPGLLNGSYVIGFVTENEGRGIVSGLVSFTHGAVKIILILMLIKALLESADGGGEAQGILLDDCTISISMTLQIHFLW